MKRVPPVDFGISAPHNFFLCVITISKYDIRDLEAKLNKKFFFEKSEKISSKWTLC
jgi:hypothetical protein